MINFNSYLTIYLLLTLLLNLHQPFALVRAQDDPVTSKLPDDSKGNKSFSHHQPSPHNARHHPHSHSQLQTHEHEHQHEHQHQHKHQQQQQHDNKIIANSNENYKHNHHHHSHHHYQQQQKQHNYDLRDQSVKNDRANYGIAHYATTKPFTVTIASLNNRQHHQQQHQHRHHNQQFSKTAKPKSISAIRRRMQHDKNDNNDLTLTQHAHNQSKSMPLPLSLPPILPHKFATTNAESAAIPFTSTDRHGERTSHKQSPHLKAITHNGLGNWQQHEHSIRSSTSPWNSFDSDYDDDYYDDTDHHGNVNDVDGEADADAEGMENTNEDTDTVAYDEYYDDDNVNDGNDGIGNDFFTGSRFSDHEYARVPRDHRRRGSNGGGRQQQPDYADDEPYRGSSEQLQNIDEPGVLTAQKFRELGTMEAVQQSHDKFLQEKEQQRQKTPTELANEHRNRMKVATRCNRPLPRVIHVSNETSKRYIPLCTILHRCGEDTGCCESTRQVCVAKSYEDVEVYFFVIKINSKNNRPDTEVLVLRNHTECHCVDRSNLTMDYMLRDKRSQRREGGIIPYLAPNHNQHHWGSHTHKHQEHRNGPKWANPMESNIICRCPRHFDVFPLEDTMQNTQSSLRTVRQALIGPQSTLSCRCDCLSSNVPCERLKNGDEGFAVDDRKCIMEGVCRPPTCSNGDYSSQSGRCPRSRNQRRTIAQNDYGFG